MFRVAATLFLFLTALFAGENCWSIGGGRAGEVLIQCLLEEMLINYRLADFVRIFDSVKFGDER
ncbi:MAG: hypothetical protein S4CHLAM81_03500 [Chlamydiales bacterium]|nr:hypothetical protein [Chlamydiales bacterium]MCH9704182.1 hypothetical protein [Chlamydiota bacterium]